MRLNRTIAPFVENIAESTTACLVTMVQGNVMALALSHWLIASETGIVAGSLASVAILVARTRKRWVVAIVLGIVTGVVDFFIHPGELGPVFLEAVLTGLGAAALSFVAGAVWRSLRARRLQGSDEVST